MWGVYGAFCLFQYASFLPQHNMARIKREILRSFYEQLYDHGLPFIR